MFNMVLRARYKEKPTVGLIRPLICVDMKIVCYVLTLFHETEGFIVKDKQFKNVEAAVQYAKLYNYKTSSWSFETQNSKN
jgi:hypothetical protein